MCLKLNTQSCMFMMDKDFVDLINTQIKHAYIGSSNGVILNFRDPTYSAESGGYHPVEIAIDDSGYLSYITDFSYMGDELAKEIDFDFTHDSFTMFDSDYDLDAGQALFHLYITNFTAYFNSGAYEVTVTAM